MRSCFKFYRHFSKTCENNLKTIMNKSNKNKTSPNSAKSMPTPSCVPPCNVNTVQKNTFQVLPTPIKSESDKKEYKVIKLDNGLIACLISDMSSISKAEGDEESESDGSEGEETEVDDSSASEGNLGTEDESSEDEGSSKKRHPTEQKMAAAGLCVGVGSFSDPKEVPGMAHFLEHMVFMGSEKYPKENYFDELIKQTGGSNNAATDMETTVFYFECLEKYLEKSLDVFSQFFIAPLLKREAMTREREAIESEFQLAIPSDSSRQEQLLCNMAKPDSPVNSFGWGNLQTLRDNIKDDDLYKSVHEFRKRHYSSHRMTVAVQARLPLEKLELFVLNTFSKVPNNGLPPENFSEIHKNVFDTPDFNKIYYVIPVKDICEVVITWALPSLKDKYRSKPHHFLAYLLSYEGIGSLLSYLKKKLWVIGTSIGNSESGSEHNSLYTSFTINLNLTEEGFSHVNEVIESVFSYLTMLRQSGIQQSIFDELQSISNMGFKYAEEESPVELVEDLCDSMQFYPPIDYITGPELYFEFDPDSVNMLIDQMTPDRANFMILKPNKPCERTDHYQTEKWFGTKYLIKDIPECWMSQWKNARIIPELSIPPPNKFITTDFTILPEKTDNPDYPQKIFETPLTELWYRRDMKFKLPIAYYYFYIISPLSLANVKNGCLLDTLVNLLAIDISEEIYPATSASLSYSFSAYEKGLMVKVWGFNQKLPNLANLIVEYLNNLHNRINEEMFEAIKDKLLKNYYNKLLKTTSLAKDVRLNLIANNNWHPVDRYLAMSDISFSDIKTYAQEFFKSLYIKALVQGNVSESTAIETVKEVMQKLNYTELKKDNSPTYEVVRVNQGERCCRMKSFSVTDSNSTITNYYQSDHYTIENSVIADLIMMVIEEPLFDTLRTKEQLGYDVDCAIRDTFGVLGYTITVNAQATKVTTKYVDERIEAFLKHTQSLLDEFDEKRFQSVKTNLIKTKQCSDIHLKEEVDRNWSEITNEDYIFDRIKQEIETIKSTDLAKVRSWWYSHNSFGNKENFRKLSIQIEGNTDKSKGTPQLEVKFLSDENEATEKGDTNYFIKSIQEYKESVEIFNVK